MTRIRRTRVLPPLWAAAIGLLLVGVLAGCGKKSDVAPPEGEASSYTYPRAYPAPDTVRPATDDADPGRNFLSPFGKPRETSTTSQPTSP